MPQTDTESKDTTTLLQRIPMTVWELTGIAALVAALAIVFRSERSAVEMTPEKLADMAKAGGVMLIGLGVLSCACIALFSSECPPLGSGVHYPLGHHTTARHAGLLSPGQVLIELAASTYRTDANALPSFAHSPDWSRHYLSPCLLLLGYGLQHNSANY